MPIYAYKCSACGHARDVLQKMSDPVLTVCPACGAESFTKQLTAAGFQLKGSGWYATDFKGGPAPGAAAAATDKAGEAAAPASAPAEGSAAPVAKEATKAAPAASPAPAPSSSTSGAN